VASSSLYTARKTLKTIGCEELFCNTERQTSLVPGRKTLKVLLRKTYLPAGPGYSTQLKAIAALPFRDVDRSDAVQLAQLFDKELDVVRRDLAQ
jgi:hypothetical protein